MAEVELRTTTPAANTKNFTYFDILHSLQRKTAGQAPCPASSSKLQPSPRRPAGQLRAPTAVQVPLFVVIKRNPRPLGVPPRITAAGRSDDDHRRAGGQAIVVAVSGRIDRRGIHGNRNRLARNNRRGWNGLNRGWTHRWNRIGNDWRFGSRHGCKRINLGWWDDCRWSWLGSRRCRHWRERIDFGRWLNGRSRFNWRRLGWLCGLRSKRIFFLCPGGSSEGR